MVKVVGSVAAFVGYSMRFVLSVFAVGWRLVPFMLITYGITQLNENLGWIAAGVFLILLTQPPKLDRRTK